MKNCSICKKPSKYVRCSTCNVIYMKEYYKNNKEILLEKQKKYNEENIVDISIRRKRYRSENKEKIAIAKKESHQRTREKDLLRSKKWYNLNKARSKELNNTWKANNKDTHRGYKNDYAKDRYLNDLHFRIGSCLRARLRAALKNKSKKGSAVRDLGCTIAELISYLESKFYEGMSWENYGNGKDKWQVDHIINLDSYNLENREEFLKANHYTNLQPLWFKDHIIKSAKERWGDI